MVLFILIGTLLLSAYQRTIWNEDIEEDIFSYIKKTPEFNFCKDKVFSKIEIYLDET